MTSSNYLFYSRRVTRPVMVGNVGIGGNNPIRVQSMTIADTMDTRATVREVAELAEAGCEIVRITAPSLREAENLGRIKSELIKLGVDVPLVADIHFTPNAALVAAEHVEKVRINPGNYADKKKFEQRDYTENEYAAELRRIEEKFRPLVLKCKTLKRAMRIGTNHGSLSDRIMNRFGDTAEGMVESALEFVHMCRKFDYHDIILSMKSSNPLVAIQAYRLLAARMDELGMDYPFHLGVTEAGDGVEGRIKSAVGIGALLEDGIGDTIRVSLTEDAVAEVPVAHKLVEKYNSRIAVRRAADDCIAVDSPDLSVVNPNPFEYRRRETIPVNQVYYTLGAGNLPRVELTLNSPLHSKKSALAEIGKMLGRSPDNLLSLVKQSNGTKPATAETVHLTVKSQDDLNALTALRHSAATQKMYIPFAVDVSSAPELAERVARFADRLVFSCTAGCERTTLTNMARAGLICGKPVEWKIVTGNDGSRMRFCQIDDALNTILEVCAELDFWDCIFSLGSRDCSSALVHDYHFLAGRLDARQATLPILLRFKASEQYEATLLQASSQLGVLLCDGIGDSIHIDSDSLPPGQLLDLSYTLLQATRMRITKTDYISCPSCGRTLFDLQTTTERIKSKTNHLTGVKIAIMGCIVNGPGEMADADFGYVGAGPGVVDLFVGKERVERNIAESEADERLIRLIKQNGRWVEQ